jgi:hypothetical protein
VFEREEINVANEMSRQRAKENNIARASRILNQKDTSPTKSYADSS